jgi:hypothetical protein
MDIRSEELLKKQIHALNERIKELNCLYAISEIAGERFASIEAMMVQIAARMPHAWQYPDITCAQITLNNQVYETENFQDSPWEQTAGIKIKDQKIGTVKVCYLEKKPECDEGPFLKEERLLINEIALRIARIIERKNLEQEHIRLNRSLQHTLEKVLSGFLPICASCKKIRDEQGNWHVIESYVSAHTEAQFTHGICPDCAAKLYPDFYADSLGTPSTKT